MTTEQKQVRDWMAAFGQECPEKPTIPSLKIRKLRAKLILEEALETIKALGFSYIPSYRPGGLFDGMILIGNEDGPNLAEIADGCEDQKVVTEGTLVACGLTPERIPHGYNTTTAVENDPLFDEVMRSNFSKMWTLQELETIDRSKFDITKVKFNLDTPRETTKYIVKDKDGKVIKSPSYSPANLQPIIDSMK